MIRVWLTKVLPIEIRGHVRHAALAKLADDNARRVRVGDACPAPRVKRGELGKHLPASRDRHRNRPSTEGHRCRRTEASECRVTRPVAERERGVRG